MRSREPLEEKAARNIVNNYSKEQLKQLKKEHYPITYTHQLERYLINKNIKMLWTIFLVL